MLRIRIHTVSKESYINITKRAYELFLQAAAMHQQYYSIERTTDFHVVESGIGAGAERRITFYKPATFLPFVKFLTSQESEKLAYMAS